MDLKFYQALQRPGRYLGTEIGVHQKNINSDDFKIALSFPDVYDIAHGHLGHKIIYQQINDTLGFIAERVYAPWPDKEKQLRSLKLPLRSLENKIPLKDFDLIGFSLQYELSFTNILNMLNLGNIPLEASERGRDFPLVMAGGPGSFNPEPIADFFDIFFLGDSETNFMEVLKIIKTWNKNNKTPKKDLYEQLAGLPGVYIPSLFKAVYDECGQLIEIASLKNNYQKVMRSLANDLNQAPFPTCQIVPFIKPVHDRVMVEIARGCSQGCRFCQAGYIYRPVRERSLSKILSLTRENLKNSGQDETSFLSLSAGDYSQITPLITNFMNEHADNEIALSLPSLRVKSLTKELATQIKRVRKTGFTIAPEAGSQRLRNVINKNLTEDDVLEASELAYSLGWKLLKFYFMIGLPTENEDDLFEIAKLCKKVQKISRGRLNVGISHFTPKAHTPFQWEAASDSQTIEDRLWFIRDNIKIPGLASKWNKPKASWVESILARGGRNLAPIIKRVYEKGARFEAWDDFFNAKLWEEAFLEADFNLEVMMSEKKSTDILPYAHLSAGIDPKYLWQEREKAYRAETTPDCRFSHCHNCGACFLEFNHLKSKIIEANEEEIELKVLKTTEKQTEKTFLLSYAKKDSAILISHLETMELFKRALRRANLKASYTQGFHPQPKLSFLTPLALGIESEKEYFKISLLDPPTAIKVLENLQKTLPQGFYLQTCSILNKQEDNPKAVGTKWEINYEKEAIFNKLFTYPILTIKQDRKKDKTYNLEKHIRDFCITNNGHGLSFSILFSENGAAPKPQASLEAMFDFESNFLNNAQLIKTDTILFKG